MATFTIRDLDEETNHRLHLRAARQHRSVENEALQILREALGTDIVGGPDVASAIIGRFQPLGGVELVVPTCEDIAAPTWRRRWRR